MGQAANLEGFIWNVIKSALQDLYVSSDLLLSLYLVALWTLQGLLLPIRIAISIVTAEISGFNGYSTLGQPSTQLERRVTGCLRLLTFNGGR